MTRIDLRPRSAWPGCALGAWAAAWLAGDCAPDEVIAALADVADAHRIDDHTGEITDPDTATLTLLGLLRGARAVTVVLPGPGDPQGLPPGAATTAALTAGEAVLVDDPRSRADAGPLALVPTLDTDTPEFRSYTWSVFRLSPGVDVAGIHGGASAGEVERQLREAIREATALFAGIGDAPGSRPAAADLRDRLAHLVAAHEIALPPHARDLRSTRMIETAATIDGIVGLAADLRVSVGHSASQLLTADTELRRLSTAARTARAAAVNTTIGELLRPR